MKENKKIIYKTHEIVVMVLFGIFLIWGGYKYLQNQKIDNNMPPPVPQINNGGPSRRSVEEYINNKTTPEGFNAPKVNPPQ